MKRYFVTGATGAVGSAVVARLMTAADTEVVALMRADAEAEAGARLDHTMAALGSDARVAMGAGRLRALRGNAEALRFGLAEDDYRRLERGSSHIVHCAGVVRMNLPLAAARRSAVDAARNVIALAQGIADAGKLAKVEMVSTVGVAGRAHRSLGEDWVGADHPFHNSYEQAKAEAEVTMREAVSRGLPLTVHRPSMVVGDSRTGRALHFQVFYHLVEFLSGRRTAGWFPTFGNARIDIVPVDFVAEAIVRSSERPATAGRIMHLCAGPHDALALATLQTAVRQALLARGERIPGARYVSRKLFRWAARDLRWFAGPRTRAALATLPVFLDYLDTEQAFDNAGTAAWLNDERLALPRAETYLPRVLEYYFAARSRNGIRGAP